MSRLDSSHLLEFLQWLVTRFHPCWLHGQNFTSNYFTAVCKCLLNSSSMWRRKTIHIEFFRSKRIAGALEEELSSIQCISRYLWNSEGQLCWWMLDYRYNGRFRRVQYIYLSMKNPFDFLHYQLYTSSYRPNCEYFILSVHLAHLYVFN